MSVGMLSFAGWQYPGATFDLDAANGRYFGGTLDALFPVSRIGSNATDLLPTSASGASYNTFGANTIRLTPGVGVLCEESRINYLLNSTSPATQTTQSLATGTYTLWVNGSGSATSSAGTATITGAGAATNGNPNTFVVTVAGTVTVTVAGSLQAFQLELGGASNVYAGSSLVITGSAIGVRAADQFAFANAAFDMVSSSGFSMVFNGCKRFSTNLGFLIGGNDSGAFCLSDNDSSLLRQGLNGVAFLAQSSTILSQGVSANVGTTYNPGANAVKMTGGTLATSATATAQTPDTFYSLGNRGGQGYYNGYFGRLAMFSTPMPSSTLGGLI